MPHNITLKRSLSLPLLTLYGLGTTIGAGIFALIGKVAGRAELFAPVSFLLASLLAAFTAFSFAELSSRFPRSAGEAVYVREGLRSRHLAVTVGLLVGLAGAVSAAAIVNGAVGYLHEFLDLARPAMIVLLVMGLGIVAAWGITESVTTVSLITLVEIGGLGLVVWAGSGALADLPARAAELAPPLELAAWSGILGGAFLAFYAFLGFEDMVNVAEEVKRVSRTLPAAIILTLVITTLLYILLALTAVLALPPAELAASEAPLALIFERGTGASPAVISLISIFAILNGGLIQVIMASRMLYGLASQGLLPTALSAVHPLTRTPLVATVLVTGVVLALALWFPIEPLAEATSIITLTVFTDSGHRVSHQRHLPGPGIHATASAMTAAGPRNDRVLPGRGRYTVDCRHTPGPAEAGRAQRAP
jgi:amino acid transporter